jgi:hypothetical protein
MLDDAASLQLSGAFPQIMSHSPSARLACILTILAAAALQPAHAADDFSRGDVETPSPITDYFEFQASFLHAKVNTDLRVDPPGQYQGGTALSGIRDLGFRPSENDGLLDLLFRLRDRNRIRADFMELDQAGTTTLTRPVVFGDQVFPSGASVNANVQWRVMGFSWTYALFQNDRFELGAGIGVHVMDLDVRAAVPSTFASYEVSTVGALPTPALEAALRITRRISMTVRGQYLHAARHGTSGVMEDFHADAQFRVVPNFAIGAGYALVRLRLDTDTDANPGMLGIRLGGPEIFVQASF